MEIITHPPKLFFKSGSPNDDDNASYYLVFNYSLGTQVKNNKQGQAKFRTDFSKLGDFTVPVLHADMKVSEIVKNPEPIIIPFAFVFNCDFALRKLLFHFFLILITAVLLESRQKYRA